MHTTPTESQWHLKPLAEAWIRDFGEKEAPNLHWRLTRKHRRHDAKKRCLGSSPKKIWILDALRCDFPASGKHIFHIYVLILVKKNHWSSKKWGCARCISTWIHACSHRQFASIFTCWVSLYAMPMFLLSFIFSKFMVTIFSYFFDKSENSKRTHMKHGAGHECQQDSGKLAEWSTALENICPCEKRDWIIKNQGGLCILQHLCVIHKLWCIVFACLISGHGFLTMLRQIRSNNKNQPPQSGRHRGG